MSKGLVQGFSVRKVKRAYPASKANANTISDLEVGHLELDDVAEIIIILLNNSNGGFITDNSSSRTSSKGSSDTAVLLEFLWRSSSLRSRDRTPPKF